MVVAYEPVWAIGTGRTATPAEAQAVHATLRARLAQAGAADVLLLYGGSVKADNAKALFANGGHRRRPDRRRVAQGDGISGDCACLKILRRQARLSGSGSNE